MGRVCSCELVSTAVMSCVEDSISHFCLFLFFFPAPYNFIMFFQPWRGWIDVLSVEGWSSQQLFYQLCITLLTAGVSLSKKTVEGSLDKTRIIGSLLQGLKLPQPWALVQVYRWKHAFHPVEWVPNPISGWYVHNGYDPIVHMRIFCLKDWYCSTEWISGFDHWWWFSQ